MNDTAPAAEPAVRPDFNEVLAHWLTLLNEAVNAIRREHGSGVVEKFDEYAGSPMPYVRIVRDFGGTQPTQVYCFINIATRQIHAPETWYDPSPFGHGDIRDPQPLKFCGFHCVGSNLKLPLVKE